MNHTSMRLTEEQFGRHTFRGTRHEDTNEGVVGMVGGKGGMVGMICGREGVVEMVEGSGGERKRCFSRRRGFQSIIKFDERPILCVN